VKTPAGHAPRLLLFAGLGADARVFEGQFEEFPNLYVPPWIDPREREPLGDYARRMAERTAAALGDVDRPLFVGGVSLGGMIALEAARHLRPRAVFLIASCRSWRSVPALYLPVARGVRFVPPRAMHVLAHLSPLAAPFFGPLSAVHRRKLVAVLRDTPPAFLRWAFPALAEWSAPRDMGVPVHHIHGSCDRILPRRLADPPPDRVVAGAGHLLNLTNAKHVNSFLRKMMSTVERP
jgi:pimeloyl-ACP methyl ester carboxylesterase